MEFNEWGTIQLISYIFKKKKIQRINYTKLLKLIYLMERECINQGLPPITYSQYVLMKNGPVILDILDRIKANYLESESIWQEYLKVEDTYNIRFIKNCEVCYFSPKYTAIFDSIIDKYKGSGYSRMIEATHQNGEEWYNLYYKRPDKSVKKIDLPLDKILDALGKTTEEKEEYKKLYVAYGSDE